jgi:uncharacterized protein
MTERTFTDFAPLNGTRMTADGYMVAEVRCARTGCQDYMASDLGIMGGGVITVYRPEEVVFDKASLATFAGKPVTMGHPTEPVTADNWKAHAIGDIGTEIARDGEFVRVPIKLMDGVAIRAVMDGTREISMGYTTGIKLEDGVAPDGTKYQAVQTGPIRINHLAVVPRARGGASLRVGDGANNWGAAPITPNGKDTAMADANLTTVVLGDKAVSVAVSDAPAIEAFKAATAKTLADMAAKAKEGEEEADKKMAAKDADLAKKDAQIADLQGKVLDAAALDKLVADRADLIARAKSLAEIKQAVVLARLGDAAKDKSAAYIDAAFDLLGDGKADPLKAALGDAITARVADRDTIYAKRDKDLSNAWKTPKVEA